MDPARSRLRRIGLHLPIRLRRNTDPERARTLSRGILDALQLLGLAFGHHEAEIRDRGVTHRSLLAELDAAKRRESLAWEILDIATGRFAKIPARNHPHYTPAQRFRILEVRSLLGWSNVDAARVFLLSPNTLTNWDHAVDQETRTVGSLVQPIPPLRRIADVVRRLVERAALLGYAGQTALAAHVAAAGASISPRSVGRFLRERPPARIERTEEARATTPLIANFVHHVWIIDSTVIHSFFRGRDLGLSGVLDAFSRAPLAMRSYEGRPSASMMARLLRQAVRALGAPKYLIADRGKEFDNAIFRRMCARLGIVLRFASTQNIFATARLERFWRTMKDQARLRAPSPAFDVEELEGRLARFFTHHILFRPHRGLGFVTPAEAFVGVVPAITRARPAPRGRQGDGPDDIGIDIGFVDPERRRYPFLVPLAA